MYLNFLKKKWPLVIAAILIFGILILFCQEWFVKRPLIETTKLTFPESYFVTNAYGQRVYVKENEYVIEKNGINRIVDRSSLFKILSAYSITRYRSVRDIPDHEMGIEYLIAFTYNDGSHYAITLGSKNLIYNIGTGKTYIIQDSDTLKMDIEELIQQSPFL